MINRRLAGVILVGGLLAACSDSSSVSGGSAAPVEAPPVAHPNGAADQVASAATVAPTSSLAASTTVSSTTAPSTTIAPAPTAPEATAAPTPSPTTATAADPPAAPVDPGQPPVGGPPIHLPLETHPAPAVAPGREAESFAVFDQVIEDATLGRGATTVGIALAYRGTIVHQSAAGLEDSRSGVAPSPASRFRIASISKVATASAVLQLVERGLVSLDETPLESFGLPLGDPRMASITVRQLLSHTTGFPQAESLFFRAGAASWQDAAGQAIGATLDFDPGTGFRYSNSNFVILGALIEARMGTPYEQAIGELVLGPLGVTSMRMAGTFDVRAGDVYHPSTAGRNYMETLGPAGQWIATPADALRLVLGIDAATSVSAASAAMMRTPVPPVAPAVAPGYLPWTYGLGLRLWDDGSWGHTGTIEHAKGIVLVRPDGWAVSILDNGDVPTRTDDLVGIIELALHAMS